MLCPVLKLGLGPSHRPFEVGSFVFRVGSQGAQNGESLAFSFVTWSEFLEAPAGLPGGKPGKRWTLSLHFQVVRITARSLSSLGGDQALFPVGMS